MKWFLPFALGSVLFLTSVRGENTPVQEGVPLRRLCIDAPTVVLAVPLDPLVPTQFRVLSCLRGKVPAETILAPVGLTAEQMTSYEEPDLARKKPRPRQIAQALLFLEQHKKEWRLLPGGLRMCGEDRVTVAPIGPNGQLRALSGVRWSVLVNRVRQDLTAVDQLNAYRRIGRPARRTEALLGWIQARKAEFAALPPGSDESPAGWDHLQLDVFDWIFEAATPESGWKAVCLYAELNQGDAPRLLSPVFSTPSGRAYLATIACDTNRLIGDRIRATRLLGERITLWPNTADCQRGAVPMPRSEQEQLLDRLANALSEKEEGIRGELARTLVRLSESGKTYLPTALNRLVQAYRDSQPGEARDELAQALCSIASPEQYTALTGNPPGFCACLRDLSRQDKTLTFWLSLRTPGPAVFEAPELVVERLGRFGFVAETKRYPIQPKNLGSWLAGWDGEDTLVVQFDISKWTPNSSYRLRVEGHAGKGAERVKWTSEPKKLLLPNWVQTETGGIRFYK